MLNFSMIISGSAAVTYLLDTHGPNGLHCLTLSNFSKNMVLYGTTFFANGMVLNRGVRTSLLILGGCQAFCFVWSIPMYIFGKRVRSYVSTLDEPCAMIDGTFCRSREILNCSPSRILEIQFPCYNNNVPMYN